MYIFNVTKLTAGEKVASYSKVSSVVGSQTAGRDSSTNMSVMSSPVNISGKNATLYYIVL